MFTLHLKTKAKEDLKNIWRYSYEKWGIDQADIYFNEIAEKLDLLQNNPSIGMNCDYIRMGYRQYPINKHIVFYKLSNNQIDIIRVLHAKMDIRSNIQLH